MKTRIHEADRNRPDDLDSAWTGDAGNQFIGMLSAGVEGGSDAAHVAGIIVDAIKTDRFWILPHGADSLAAVQRRTDAIVDGAEPPQWGRQIASPNE